MVNFQGKHALIITQLILHVGIGVLLTFAIDNALFRWEFYGLLMAIFMIRGVERNICYHELLR